MTTFLKSIQPGQDLPVISNVTGVTLFVFAKTNNFQACQDERRCVKRGSSPHTPRYPRSALFLNGWLLNDDDVKIITRKHDALLSLPLLNPTSSTAREEAAST
ncbi:MAG TPA: hypothetical protein VFV38_08835 [Ktedonobacteraceae bacterium]|nr:hypothetical protein [Ktedonobacteraceae bacterium]